MSQVSWVPVESKPDLGEDFNGYMESLPTVLLACKGKTGRRLYTLAQWCPRWTVDAEYWEDGAFEWNEDESECYGLEGWYEVLPMIVEAELFYAIPPDVTPTHWTTVPEVPE